MYLSKSFGYLFCNTSLQKSCLTLFPCLRQMFSTNIRLFLSKKSTCNHRFVDIGIDNQLEIPSYPIPCHSFCYLVCHLGHSRVCLCHLRSMLLCRNGIKRIIILRENFVLLLVQLKLSKYHSKFTCIVFASSSTFYCASFIG